MRTLLGLSTAAVVTALLVPAGASAAKPVRCKAREGVQVVYAIQSRAAGSVSCSSAFAITFAGILEKKPPSGWTCRQPADRSWPIVETCSKRVKGRSVAKADMYEVPGPIAIPSR